ncbi:MAG TPA: hypothetical protein VFL17_10490 [Anaerolineae bacterium]|nr:hypothetical protein [Anaerolineae bacterium]
MRKPLYVLIAMLLLGKLEAASACSMVPLPSDADLFAKASTVFVARIVRAEEVEMQFPTSRWGQGVTGSGVDGTFRLIEVLKGQPPADGKVRGPMPFMCMMPLMVAVDYVIFLNEGDNVIVWAMDKGTRPLPPDLQKLGAPLPANDPGCQLRAGPFKDSAR